MKEYWKSKEGKLIKYEKLHLTHLKHIIAYVERKAKDGMKIIYGDVSGSGADAWADEKTIYGEDVEQHFDYEGLKEELHRRDKNG